MTIQVQLKQAGKRGNSVARVPMELGGVPDTVEELLRLTVKACIKGFRERQDEALRPLEQDELDRMAESGRIAFQFFYGNTEVKEEQAIETALQAFEDGIVAVFVDGKQETSREARIILTEQSTVTFVRLVLLAGRIW